MENTELIVSIVHVYQMRVFIAVSFIPRKEQSYVVLVAGMLGCVCTSPFAETSGWKYRVNTENQRTGKGEKKQTHSVDPPKWVELTVGRAYLYNDCYRTLFVFMCTLIWITSFPASFPGSFPASFPGSLALNFSRFHTKNLGMRREWGSRLGWESLGTRLQFEHTYITKVHWWAFKIDLAQRCVSPLCRSVRPLQTDWSKAKWQEHRKPRRCSS